MDARRTEERNFAARGLDALPDAAILELLANIQVEAAASVKSALPALAKAADAAAVCLEAGGRLVYAAAGSSGLMALADALELPGTFGIDSRRIVVLLAGGAASLTELVGGPEDDEAAGAAAISGHDICATDCVIAVSASGTTPYTLAALRAAMAAGATTVGMAGNADAPMLAEAEIAVHLATPPEVVAGSTRMGAGTAQKIALNLISTLMAVRLGHVHDGYMVNLRADNAKLEGRAARIVADISGCTQDQARGHLAAAGGAVKTAVLMAAGARDLETAEAILDSTGRRLRPALSIVQENDGSNQTAREAPATGRWK